MNKLDAHKRSKTGLISRILHESSVEDIIEAIKIDHEVLKKFIKVMKEEGASTKEKKEAYVNFASLLKSHSSSEERALYERCLKKKNLEVEAQEGFVEHQVASLLAKAVEKTKDKARWTAQIKVLAELVEHHIEEEESELLPSVKKEFSSANQTAMGSEFISLRRRSQRDRSKENSGVLQA